MRVRSQPISSSAIALCREYFEFETANEERKPLGGCGIGGGGKLYRKQWEWVDGDGIRVVVAAVVRKRVQESGRKKASVAAAESRRRTRKAATAASTATNGKEKRKPEAEAEEGGRPSAGGPHRCGARRGQSAAA